MNVKADLICLTSWSSFPLTSRFKNVLTGLCFWLWRGHFGQWLWTSADHPRGQTWKHPGGMCRLLTAGRAGRVSFLLMPFLLLSMMDFFCLTFSRHTTGNYKGTYWHFTRLFQNNGFSSITSVLLAVTLFVICLGYLRRKKRREGGKKEWELCVPAQLKFPVNPLL